MSIHADKVLFTQKHTHTCFVDKRRSYKVTLVYCSVFFLVYRADIRSHIVGIKQHHIGEFECGALE